MRPDKTFNILLILSFSLFSCHSLSNNKPTNTGGAAAKNDSSTNTGNDKTADAKNNMFDSAKLKSGLNDLLNSISSGKPDTTKLKNVAADILSTDAAVLSDSGIDNMYGNSNDPAISAAKNMLKNMRDKMGITPDKLDSIKKAAAQLREVSH